MVTDEEFWALIDELGGVADDGGDLGGRDVTALASVCGVRVQR